MNMLGVIFADSYDVDLKELTDKRTLAAVPFGGRYRVIDFMLSNMANAGIRNIGIITTRKYDSLMGHVRSGSVWDLDRKMSGVSFLPPFATGNMKSVYENRLEAMQANLTFFRNKREKYVLFGSCNYVANIDFKKMLDYHIATGAKITGLYTRKPVNKQLDLPTTEYKIAHDGRITDVSIVPGLLDGMDAATNTYIIGREDLIDILEETLREGKKSFRRDVLIPEISKDRVMGYRSEDTLLFLDDISCYLKSTLALLDKDVRQELFHSEDRPIITKVKDSAPTRYGRDAVATNSLIADGAIIEGEVRDSVIFRGVKIKRGAVVENCVIMQDSTIGEDARLNYAVLDKNVIINDGRMLSGYITHPFYVAHKVVI